MSGTTSLALANRPRTWDELIGQPIPQTFFRKSLTPTTEFPHGKFWPAYLLHGASGCGKTSSALLVAKRALCENPSGPNPCNVCKQCEAIDRGAPNPNLEYIDGTTDRGLDFVKTHIEPWLRTQPMGSAKLKVMIIDEFHRYTGDAKSAFLVLLEELKQKNPRAIVLLCTTEGDKLDPAIKNRCLNLHYSPLPLDKASDYVMAKLGRDDVSEEAITILVKACGGSMREIWQALDLWTTLEEPLTEDLVNRLIRGVSKDQRDLFWKALAERQVAEAHRLWETWRTESAEPRVLGRQLQEDLLQAMMKEPLRVEWMDCLRTLSAAQLFNSDDAWLPALLTLQIPLAPTDVLKHAQPNTYVGTVERPVSAPEFSHPPVPTPEATVGPVASAQPLEAAAPVEPAAPAGTPTLAAAAPAVPAAPAPAPAETFGPSEDNCPSCGKLNYAGHRCVPPFSPVAPEIGPEPTPDVAIPSASDAPAVVRYILQR